MALDRFNENMDIIARLGDDPKRDDGLSTPQFKSVFDKAGLLIQKFLNEKLIPQIENFLDEGTVLGKITEVLSGKLDKTGGTMEGSINMNGQKLSGLNAPTKDDEAATKGYAEEFANSRRVRDRLDNSDFTHFIAQAGIGGAHEVDEFYAGDRWILDSGTVTGDANENGDGYSNIRLNGTIRQIVANAPDVGTVVIEMVSGTATISYADGEITISSSGGVIKNVSLFEGEYTAETLPEYLPKGYGAELAECQRYFRRIKRLNAVVTTYSNSSENRLNIEFPLGVPMRILPTASIINGFTILRYGGNTQAISGAEIKEVGTATSLDYINIAVTITTTIEEDFYAGYVTTVTIDLSADL